MTKIIQIPALLLPITSKTDGWIQIKPGCKAGYDSLSSSGLYNVAVGIEWKRLSTPQKWGDKLVFSRSLQA